MANKYQELTNNVRDEFIKGLEEKGLQWFADWNPKCISINGKTKVHYRGVNHLNLSFDGYADTRYFTFDQAKALGYKVPKGAKSRKIVKFSYYDIKEKKTISQAEYDSTNPNHTKFFKYYYVFNAEQLEGITLEPKALPKYDNSLIAKIANAMGVEVKNGTAKLPHYNVNEDRIELPSNSLFKSQKDYLATALHELSHATGNDKRLSREFGNKGTKAYAFEELVAEMSSALLCSYLGIENKVDDNHKAYVNGWISELKKEPKVLIDAFKKSEEAMEYIVTTSQIEGVCEIEARKVQPKVENKQVAKAETKEIAKPQPKVEDKKARLISQVESIENGIKYITWTRDDGKAFIKLAKQFYDHMSKKEKSRFNKLWCC